VRTTCSWPTMSLNDWGLCFRYKTSGIYGIILHQSIFGNFFVFRISPSIKLPESPLGVSLYEHLRKKGR
jgi:hypothetical protein